MAVPAMLNKNNSAVKRIMQEARELANDPSTEYSAAPLEDDIFEWHCTLRGPSGTDFEGGLYHFRIRLPAEYPFRPPSIMLLTPNGRFELNTKICISFTNYHEELWQPAWGVRTAIIGLQGFFPLKGQAAMGIGALEAPSSERKRLAALSRDWVCPRCNHSNLQSLPDPPPQNDSGSASASTSPPTTTTTGEKTSAEADASGVLTTPAVDVTVTPVVRSPEVKHPTPPNTTGRETEAIVNGATTSSSPPPSSASSRGGHQVVGPVASSLHQTRTHTTTSSVRPPMLLDTAICVLLVLVFALLCRRVF
ncbi:non-canonical ubiquitin conjugating enzyme 1 [Lactarius indigo]|nr:non-canonical ubiquitin conjugating enzyme 1 [Lactarius indigo]